MSHPRGLVVPPQPDYLMLEVQLHGLVRAANAPKHANPHRTRQLILERIKQMILTDFAMEFNSDVVIEITEQAPTLPTERPEIKRAYEIKGMSEAGMDMASLCLYYQQTQEWVEEQLKLIEE